VAFVALVFSNEFLTRFEIGIFEQGVLLGKHARGPCQQGYT
jgi:hypothetical protein